MGMLPSWKAGIGVNIPPWFITEDKDQLSINNRIYCIQGLM